MTRKYLYDHYALLCDYARAKDALQAAMDSDVDLATFQPIKNSVDKMENQVWDGEKKVNSFLATISRPHIQLLFRLRYIHGMTWKQVAATAGGTEDSVRSAVYKYMQENNI